MDSDILLKLVADTGILDTEIPISDPSHGVEQRENEPNWNAGNYQDELAVKCEITTYESTHLGTQATLNSEECKLPNTISNKIAVYLLC